MLGLKEKNGQKSTFFFLKTQCLNKSIFFKNLRNLYILFYIPNINLINLNMILFFIYNVNNLHFYNNKLIRLILL